MTNRGKAFVTAVAAAAIGASATSASACLPVVAAWNAREVQAASVREPVAEGSPARTRARRGRSAHATKAARQHHELDDYVW